MTFDLWTLTFSSMTTWTFSCTFLPCIQHQLRSNYIVHYKIVHKNSKSRSHAIWPWHLTLWRGVLLQLWYPCVICDTKFALKTLIWPLTFDLNFIFVLLNTLPYPPKSFSYFTCSSIKKLYKNSKSRSQTIWPWPFYPTKSGTQIYDLAYPSTNFGTRVHAIWPWPLTLWRGVPLQLWYPCVICDTNCP